MLHKLSSKLAFQLLMLLCLLGGLFAATAWHQLPAFQQELNQRLNHDLADNLVREFPVLDKQRINQKHLKSLFMTMMQVNPAIEVYLLDRDGKILGYSAPPGKVKQHSVDITPVQQFLSGSAAYPVLNVDPRQPERRKTFSAARIEQQGELAGYLYVILESEGYDSAFNLVESSYSIRMLILSGLFLLLFTFLTGLLVFRTSTRRITALASDMQAFQQTDFSHRAARPAVSTSSGDELDSLESSYDALAGRVIEQLQQLKETDQNRRELIANISHDLRTPLTAIQGYLETIMLNQTSPHKQDSADLLQAAWRQCRHLGTLVSELFELARLEQADAPIRLESFSLAELIQDVSEKFRHRADSKNIDIQVELPGSTPPVLADIGLIERALNNLLDNAIKYTPQQGHIDVSLHIENGQLVTRIHDDGPGISQQDLPHVFERFFRCKRTQDQSEGTGLGLAITRRILELHNAPIRVHSAPSQGTQFEFELRTANV